MDSEVVKAFNAELVSLYELRPPISKKKIVDITKAALKAIKYYKHVVFGIEKFLSKCKPEYKIPGLYCIDSIIRQSKHQFKDKDVFAPRFATNMHMTLINLLCCKNDEKLKVVRVLNLWKCHGIYDEARVSPWLTYCHNHHGLETDYMQVEKSVKGDQADLSIYHRGHGNIEKKKGEPHTPPLKQNRENTPVIPFREPSDESVEGGVSERETLAMLTGMGLDLGGMFSMDHGLLQKVHKIVNDKLVERREIDSRRQGNIKNLLSKEFDYSDEDESEDDENSRKLQVETKPVEFTKQQIIGMAEAVLREADTKEEIQRMHSERLTALSQAAARVQASKQSVTALNAIANPVTNPATAIPINIPLNPAPEVSNLINTTSIPIPPPIVQPQLIPSSMATQSLLTNTSQSQMPPFTPNIPPPNFMNILSTNQSNIPPQTSGRDMDDRYEMANDRDDRDHRDRSRDHRDNRRRDRSRERDRDRSDSRNYIDGRASKRIRRSRSRDRNYSEMYHDRRSGSEGRKDSARNRDKDRDNSSYRDMERHRRKMGLPWPPKEGHVLIASCTLWFGRIPHNCSEEDIRLSVAEAGEPSRISIIHSRACAYVTMKDRKAAFRVMDRMQKNIQVAKKNVKLNWGTGQGLKGEKYMDYWDSNKGYSLIPYNKLPDDLEPLLEGGHLDVETLPSHLRSLYDEHGLKGKNREEIKISGTGTNMHLPPTLPPFPFSLNQATPLGGAPPFFPPGVLPLPGTFPSLPLIDNSAMHIPPKEGQTSQTDVSSSGHFMPTNFGNQLPPRFPGNRGGYMNAPFNMRGPRPDMALSVPNIGRPVPRMSRPFLHNPLFQTNASGSRGQNFSSKVVDDSINEPVTSTTHDDDTTSAGQEDRKMEYDVSYAQKTK
ncbi:unnamed protein product [Dracunculus medinensis]|uniref:CID domain-containing protein n=1 Tax=Dracunculus medinensis TaxID=318479 RepID=A0A158Q4Z4_DRAME|nr:unnamed protein product [Dracunculus medinensis]